MSDPPEQRPSRPAPSDEFVQLFTRAQRPLYLFILAQTGNVQSAEEILQETNLVIWAKLEQFQPGSSFSGWSRQIATYEILKYRQRNRRDKLTFSDEFLTAVAGEAVTQSLEIEQRREALQHCLEKLEPRDRELIQQRYQPGMHGKELALQRERPVNSIYQSLGRIRKTLLECIHRQLAAEVSEIKIS